MLRKLRHIKNSFDPEYFKKVGFVKWMHSAYLTLKYVDEFSVFPAIQFNGKVKLKIQKDASAKIIIGKKLIIEQWINGKGLTAITLLKEASFETKGDLIFGQNILLHIEPFGEFVFCGKKEMSGSGITADSVIMVKKHLYIGYDVIIAWNTFITDCDWHNSGKNQWQKDTLIQDKVWIGVGAKVLKGSIVKENTIIGANSVVVQSEYEKNCLLSGIPAKIIKQNIPYWNRDMKIIQENAEK